MENNNYDYLNNLDVEDRMALIEMDIEHRKEEEEKYQEVMSELEEKSKIRNGALVAGVLTFTIMMGAMHYAFNATKDYKDSLKPKTTIEKIVDDNVYVIRNYTVQYNDNLTYLAKISGMTINEIKDLNNLKSDMLKYNQKLALKYTISPDNIKYLTETIQVDNRTIYEIAGLYHTTAESIYNLNKEAVEKIVNPGDRDDYTILSSTVLVPNYLSPKELQKVKK